MNTCLIALCLAGALSPLSDPPSISIECRDKIDVRGTTVLLGDLAEVIAADEAVGKRLRELEIAKRPGHGFSRVYRRTQLRAYLLQQGLQPDQFALSGADEMVLVPLSTRLMPEAMREAADPVLQAALDTEQYEEIEFSLAHQLKPLLVPPGRTDLQLRARLATETRDRQVAAVLVDIRVDGVVYRTQRINYRIRRFDHMLVPTRAIRRGERIDPSNVTLQRLEIGPGLTAALTSFDAVAGKIAKRSLRKGAPLQTYDVSEPALILTNQRVKLVRRKGRIQIVCDAIALQDGAAGELIQVRNLHTLRPVAAKVFAPGVVIH